jgi:hypothetical protein
LSGCYLSATTGSGGGGFRAGWFNLQTTLTPGLVSSSTFGEMWNADVTGQVYAQPVVHNGTVVAVTETNDVYGFDEVSGAQKWHGQVGVAFRAADAACSDLTPTIGVTGTPVIDPATNTAYFVAKRYLTGSSGPAGYFAHAVDIATGASRPGFPLRLQGTAANDPATTFNATTHLQRPGLLLMDGVVYAAFGSHCGNPEHRGWIIGFTTSGQVSTLWNDQAGETGSPGAGIWQSGGGIMSDVPGEMVITTGNGSIPDNATPGSTPPPRLGQSVVRLKVQPDKSLRAIDFFMPYDAGFLNSWDADLGSGAPMALPKEYFSTPSYPRLGLQIGKQGYLYVLDETNLGGYRQGPSGSDNVVQRLGPFGGAWSKPAAWGGDGGYVYITTASGGSTSHGTSGLLRAFKYGLDGNGKPTFSLVGGSADAFGFSSGSPVVSSDRANSGSALVWVIWSPDGSGANSQLRAYDPVPVNGTMNLRYSAPIGTSSKFSVPVISNNRVILGTRDGKIRSFGSPISSALSGSPVAFPNTTVGQSSVRTISLTANFDLDVTSLSTNDSQFVVGTPSIALPTRLLAGQTLTAPVTFTPTAPTLSSANLTAATSAGSWTFGLTGTGLSTGAQLVATPSAVSLGGAIIGGSPVTGSVSLRNAGSVPLTINAVSPPSAPFSASGLPASGSTLGPGQSIALNIVFAPTTTGVFTDAIQVQTTGGDIEIPVSGTATTAPHMTLSATVIPFGSVALGDASSMSFTVRNDGGAPLTITRSKPPAGVFSDTAHIPEGTTIPPGASVTGTVRFAPTAIGSASAIWDFNSDDGTGVKIVTFTGTGVVPTPPGPPAGGGWQLNGSASMNGSTLILTPAGNDQAGSAFWPTPVSANGLTISFDARIDQGTGADGMTLTFADPLAGATPTSLGTPGGGLGYSGIPGVAISFDTFRNGGDPSDNFVGIATTAFGDSLVFLATNSSIPPLQNATRRVVIRYTNGTLNVFIDGTLYLSQAVSISPWALVGWTAGTGGLTNRHSVSNVTFSYS